MKKKQKKRPLPDLETIRAAREAIQQERERRKTAEVTLIVTGVPRPERDGDVASWEPPPRDRNDCGLTPRAAPSSPPKAPVASEPPPRPTTWHYVFVQTRAPAGNDPGAIIEGQYATAGDVLFLSDINSNPIASQKLRADDNAAAVARKLLKERRRASSSVPGFYDSPNYNPNRVFH